jgi:mannose/fructose/N-acetylgalactosamine-specific phosphotransferase system component IIC
MSGELYLQILGYVLLTALTVPVICAAIWAVVLTYNDFIERRDLKRWKKRTIGDK